MINYFEAAEKTLRARGLLETALGNLERKRSAFYDTARVGIPVGGYVQAVHGREICKRRARGLP